MLEVIQQFIGGKIINNKGGQLHPIYDPALGIEKKKVRFALQSEIHKAIATARDAYSEWREVIPLERARILFKFKSLVEAQQEHLAQLLTLEHGKVLEDARGEVLRAIELIEFMCGIPELLKGSYSPEVGRGVDCMTLRQPLGVCVGITPFNFPVMISCWMMVPAIACGNTFILKPSEKDPSAPMLLAKLMQEAGLPDGVLNILHGDKTVVEALITNPDVQAVACVGSSSVAECVYRTAVDHGKRAQTFGGAKNHCVIMPDADIEKAAETVLGAAYGAAGERCMAVSVAVVVGDQLAGTLVKHLSEKIPRLKIGSGTVDGMDMGPLVTDEHRSRVKNYVELGIQEGAELVVDGRDYCVKGNGDGFFLGPCLFDKVSKDMRIYQEEIFGPVLVVMRVNTLDEAIELINQHIYANGAVIFTNNGECARRFAFEIEVGMVGVNIPIPVPVAYHTFGGWKRSFFGDVAMHGTEGVMFYTRSKSITTHWPKQSQQSTNFHMPSH